MLVGPSGCGKSTALRMIAGLEEISDGAVWIGDEFVNDVHPKDRDIAMVFQSYALYPHMSVYDNIAFALQIQRLPKAEIDQRVRAAARTLELEDCSSGGRASFPAASASGSPWVAPSSASRRSS